MDSLSQLALGAAVGVAVMGRRTAVWKAALWGGVCGTLPDLDAFIDQGDAVRNMVLHRAESHALFWQTLAAPVIAAGIAALHGGRALFPRWALAVWLVLVTHALLDAMTVYGTQLALPFSDHPYGVGSIFIIDPLYTLPLLVGVVAAMCWRANDRALRWNRTGLVLSSVYLAWGVVAQWHVTGIARTALAAQGIVAQQLLVVPAPFNSVLWRVVATTGDSYHEGFRSLLDRGAGMHFDRFDRGAGLYTPLAAHEPVARVAAFSGGLYAMAEDQGRVRISDLRMGQQPHYSFAFVVAQRAADGVTLQPLSAPVAVGSRPPDIGATLRWIGRRALGEPLPPPR